jgi:hypothetical protein
MFEPLADTFDIAPMDTAEIVADFAIDDQPLEIEIYPDNFMSIWVIGDVIVRGGGKNLSFPDL